MKDIFFLSGLPRAGNTLFGSIMNQNPKVAVTANSITADMMGELFSLKKIDIFQNYPDHKSFDNVAAKVFDHYYQDWKADYIIDRAPWGMPPNIHFIKKYRKNVKIIVLVRDVIEVLASFIRFSQRNPGSYIDPDRNRSVEEQCDKLMNKDGVIVKELIGVKHLLRPENKGLYHMIEYHDFKRSLVRFIPNKYLEVGLRTIYNIEQQISKYLRGQILAAGSVAVLSIIGLFILNKLLKKPKVKMVKKTKKNFFFIKLISNKF